MCNLYLKWWLPVWLLFMLFGCTPPVVHIDTPSVSDRFVEAAQAREAVGDYPGAVDYYLRAAAVTNGRQRPDILLQAAGSLVQSGDYTRATAILDRMADTPLSTTQRQLYATIQARIALTRNDADQVLMLLQTVPATAYLQADYYRLRAEAWQRKGDFIASIRERLRLDPLLNEPDRRLANHSAIWLALSRLTTTDLQRLRSAPPDPLGGWARLAELARQNLQGPNALADAILQWQMQYPGHPASEGFTDKLASGIRITGQPPQQLALLLPLTGTLANAGAAIRAGILAAYYNIPEDSQRPAIKIYDVGGDPEAILGDYHRAVSDGAQFVIGPLRKESVRVLALQQQLPVPVLALNRTGTDSVPNPMLFQFGLAPEDEAREVARRAWHDGHRRAIALLPRGIWGDRVYEAFLDEWQQLGGRLLEVERYDPDEPDHGQEISAALNLDSSRQRHQKLVRLLGHNLEFEPRRRTDIDFIFILATPGQGRLLRPQLDFYRARKIPVYATSHVYTGHPDNSIDSDMNGLFFCDIPWILDPGWEHMKKLVKDFWPDNAAGYSRFFALGIDAWRFIPYVDQPGDHSRDTYQGATGKLTLDARRQVHRSLRWAHFQDGLPVPLEDGADVLENEGVLSADSSGPVQHRLQ